MSLLKYINRLQRMHDLIRRKATGTPNEFAKRLGVGKSVLMDELRELKKLGADIGYCRVRQSYYYQTEFVLKIGKLNAA
jgi:predicted DNA-binding transcriptional regulator YafY